MDVGSYACAGGVKLELKRIFWKGKIEKDIPNCYVVDNSAYKVGEWQNGSFVILGSDRYHWNQADTLEIGENVGKAMLYCAGITKEDPFPDI